MIVCYVVFYELHLVYGDSRRYIDQKVHDVFINIQFREKTPCHYSLRWTCMHVCVGN